MNSKEAEKKESHKKTGFLHDTSSGKCLRLNLWEAEWEDIQKDMELFPQNNVLKALLDVLERKLYGRWLRSHRIQSSNKRAFRGTQVKYEYIKKDELPEEVRACRKELFIYRMGLECKFGIIFLMAFFFLTLVPLFLLSFIWTMPYRQLFCLFFISATTIIYLIPPFKRNWEHYFRCYLIPVVATVHLSMNLNESLFKTVLYLWIFTAFYVAFLSFATWNAMDKARIFFDPFGYAYLLTIRNLK